MTASEAARRRGDLGERDAAAHLGAEVLLDERAAEVVADVVQHAGDRRAPSPG
jgi:hypothetical protein